VAIGLYAVFFRAVNLLTRAALTLALLVSQAFAPLHAGTIKAGDEKLVLAVVQGQLAAIAKDDADKAFSYAAPNVRQSVGSAAEFMTMVRRGYPVVYRPSSVAFLKPEGRGDKAVQRVHMTDARGKSWLAVYSLQRQKDKLWRITGCAVAESKGSFI
jgi:Domain of unknown function (DUF4864)